MKRVLAIDVGLTKCGVCILNKLSDATDCKNNLEIEFWENLNLTMAPYTTNELINYYFPNDKIITKLPNDNCDDDDDDEYNDFSNKNKNSNDNKLIYPLPKHNVVKNSNMLSVYDKIDLIYKNLSSFAPCWLNRQNHPIDMIIIEDQNSKFSAHMDEYQHMFYMFFKVFCNMQKNYYNDNNVMKIVVGENVPKIIFQGGFCKSKIQIISLDVLKNDFSAPCHSSNLKKRKNHSTFVVQQKEEQYYKKFLIDVCKPCNLYIKKKSPPKQKKKNEHSIILNNDDNIDDDNKEQKKENLSSINNNNDNDYYDTMIENYNNSDSKYDASKRLKNKIDIVDNTMLMINNGVFKNNRYISWFKSLNNTNKRDPSDALHHAIYAIYNN